MNDSPPTNKKVSSLYALSNTAITADIAIPAVKVAVVVGIILNLINQGMRLIDGDQINWFQFTLNFVVPYCVASYSAARNELCNR